MILHGGILSLLIGSLTVVFLTVLGAVHAVDILRHWDFRSSSARQLSLERKTYLVSTVMNYALGFVVLSGFLFVYTVDDLHRLLVGAMCATGSLNANPVGWEALYTKLGLFFAGGTWIALNRLDQRAEDYPLVRLKYALLLALVPLVLLDLLLELRYFLGIEPDVITSCCGSLFRSGEDTVAGSLTAVPPVPAMWAFYLGTGAFLALGVLGAVRPRAALYYGLSVLSAGVFVLSLTAIVSFVSLYIYEIPTHHCPFDFLQEEYGFVGYPIYGSLLAATYFGLLPGAFEPLRRIPSLREEIGRSQRRWALWASGAMALFLILVSYPVVFGSFRLVGYS